MNTRRPNKLNKNSTSQSEYFGYSPGFPQDQNADFNIHNATAKDSSNSKKNSKLQRPFPRSGSTVKSEAGSRILNRTSGSVFSWQI